MRVIYRGQRELPLVLSETVLSPLKASVVVSQRDNESDYAEMAGTTQPLVKVPDFLVWLYVRYAREDPIAGSMPHMIRSEHLDYSGADFETGPAFGPICLAKDILEALTLYKIASEEGLPVDEEVVFWL